jgi:CTP synthase (UTP-ammonia lyase)
MRKLPAKAQRATAGFPSGRIKPTSGASFGCGGTTLSGKLTRQSRSHCNYGLNPIYRAALENAGMRFTAWDDAGDARGAELPSHPFFVGTLFQPERAALQGKTPPLVAAFLAACRASG